jgi:hypothetical protein
MKAKEKTTFAPSPIADNFAEFNVFIRRQRFRQRKPSGQCASVVTVIAIAARLLLDVVRRRPGLSAGFFQWRGLSGSNSPARALAEFHGPR